MKKLFLLFTVLCAAVAVQAQVISAYTMQATQGTYTEITDGIAMDTVGCRVDEGLTEKVWFPDSIATETTKLAGFPIGFDFEFNDILCNQFAIGAHGFLALGRDEICIDPTHGAYTPNQENNADNVVGLFVNTFGGFWCFETTEVSYKLIGEAPSRTLVVQFKDLGINLGWSAETIAKVNMQLRLNEAGNTIEMVFGEYTGPEGTTKSTRYALRGYYNDNLSLTKGEEDGYINYTAVGDDVSAPFGDGVVSGLTYTFTPPAECVVPEVHISLTQLETESNQFRMEWNPIVGADRALLILAQSPWLTQEPQPGTFYQVGDSVGGGVVLAFTTDTVYDSNDQWKLEFEAATKYYIHLYTANTYCTGGPLFDTGVLSSFTTKPAGPASVAITNAALNTLTFDVESNGTDNVIVLLTDSVRLNPPYANVLEFGTPIGQQEVGDVIDGMGRVVYMGSSAQGVVVDNLDPGTVYYLRALSYNEEYTYSTACVECSDVTVATLPWSLDLTYTGLGDVPAGWESDGWTAANPLSGFGVGEKQLELRTSPNAETGYIANLTTPRILVDKRDALLTFQYCMYIWARFGGNQPYSTWAENDKLSVQISRNGGEFEEVHTIDATNNVTPDSVNQYISVNVDLAEYVNDEIRIRVHWECFSSSQVRMLVEGWMLDGRLIPVIPEVTVGEVTWNSALVSWRGEQESFEFAYAKAGEEFTAQVVTEKQVTLTDLTHLTDYQVKVRGIVAEGDTTDWSEVVAFTTADLPECPIPDGLTHVETEDYGDKLSWNLNEEHLSWDLRYRESSSTTWIDVEGLTTNEYVLYDLTAGAAYLWRVRAYCDMDRVSNYASQETFNANGKSAISVADADRLTVVAGNGVINVYNTDVYVESVTLLDMQGRVVANYAINGRENITIPTNATGVALVVVKTIDNQFVYKVKM